MISIPSTSEVSHSQAPEFNHGGFVSSTSNQSYQSQFMSDLKRLKERKEALLRSKGFTGSENTEKVDLQ